MTSPPALSDLDTARFGVTTARADVRAAEDVEICNEFCREHRVRLLIARCATSAISAVQRLEEEGARLMDCQVCYRLDFRAACFADVPDHVDYVRVAGPNDAAKIADVAASAFHRYGGHYHSDPRLRPVDATGAYTDWAVRLCANRDDQAVFVACRNDAIVGFVAVQRNARNEVEVVLGAVTPRAQGSGIPYKFLFHVHRWGAQRGMRRSVLWTKITNLPLQRAMVRHGYEVVSSAFVLHTWYDVFSSQSDPSSKAESM